MSELLRANDIRFAEFAAGLSGADWSHRSLCSAWTNHEVLAHLVLGYRASLAAFAVEIAANRGSFDRANAALATQLALRRRPADLLDDFALLMSRPRGIGRLLPRRLMLGDHVIHELDIAFALGREPTIDARAAVAVLNIQVRVPNPFVPAAARARGLRLHATDVDWACGDSGPAVAGRATELASVLAGRPWALDRLHGDGVEQLRSRL